MSSLTTSKTYLTLGTTAVAAAMAGLAVMSPAVPAGADPHLRGLVTLQPTFAVQDDPGCEVFGWRHPMCAGGAFDTPPDDGIPGDNAAEGGIPAPAMVPNVDGTLSPPGTPGAV
jgi:hypothetical protein